MSRRSRLVVLLGVLGFGVLLLGPLFSTSSVQGLWGVPQIEDHLADEAGDVLDPLGFDARQIDVSGNDLTITTDRELQGATKSQLQAIDGVDSIDFLVDPSLGTAEGERGDGSDGDGDSGDVDDLADGSDGSDGDGADSGDGADGADGGDGGDGDAEPTAIPEPVGGEVEFTYDGSTAVVAGQVETEEGRDALSRATRRLIDSDEFIDEVVVTGGSGEDLDRVSTIAAVIRRLDEWYASADLTLEGDDLVVTGEAFDEARAVRAGEVISQLGERVGLEVVVDSVLVEGSAAADSDDADSDGAEDDSNDGADENDSNDTADTGDGADSGDETATTDEGSGADDDADSADGSYASAGEDALLDGDADRLALARDVVAGLDLSGLAFEPGSAVLAGSSQAILDDIAAQLRELPGVPIEVQGHTDDVGDPDVNLLLSLDRAFAVRDYLANAGADGSVLTAQGFGPARPIADNSTEEGRAANNRVVLVVPEGN
ncbi:MAG: OmpA family protein [Actinomycetota bacterium]